MSDEKNMELEALDKQIAHLRLAAENKQKELWKLTYSETVESQQKVLVPLEEKQKERRLLVGRIKAAETRARNKAEREKQKAAR